MPMKTQRFICRFLALHSGPTGRLAKAILLIGGAVLAQTVAHAQSYTIDWFTLDGGGGTSAGGGFTLASTIGQSDAGTMTGGGFALAGGFWSLLSTVQPPPGPLLSIHRASLGVVLSWPLAVTGFTLEYTTQLGSGIWTTETMSVVDTATEHTVTVPTIIGHRFYRLKK